MSEDLFAIFCTAEIPAETLSVIIEAAYSGGPDSAPSLYLLTSRTVPPSSQPEPSQPPIATPLTYPFLSCSLEEITSFLDSDTCRGSAISTHHFLIADEQTNQDNSLLFVDRGYELNQTPKTVRLDAPHVNAIPVAVQVATMDMNGILPLTDEDGVYRGGPARPAPRKGEPAPRKRL